MALDVALDRPAPAPAAAAGAVGGTGGRAVSGWVHRARLGVVCLGFLALTLSQQPGRLVADTKLDLVVDPLGFLGRALSMWEPQGFAGQVQNQAYGYLFPMGPFFVLGETSGAPMWVVQRLWMALLLCVAFLGLTTLARRLRIGTPEAQLLAGLAYALAPRMVTGLGATSIEVLPMALAPWVLVPLVTGARSGSPRRAAALSGLAVFCVGGVNAVATAAVLPLAALWLLTRPAGPRRRRLIGWWTASVLLATSWWAGPLLLLGRYSPPFLDHIEAARTTTSVTDLTSVLRGTTQWLAYLASSNGPLWPAGWALVHDVAPVVATVVLAAAGLFALTRRDLPERTWLVLGLLAGLVLVTAGHLGTVSGALANPLHTALDGVLAPLRNVHKFDPVLRVPLALGLAHVAGRLWRTTRRRHRTWAGAARAGIGLLVVALLATASPALAGRLTPPTGFTGIPEHWSETADWLADAAPEGRALLVPGSSFATYVWGGTADEPMQPLASSPWEVRNAIPFSSTGHIRALDAIEERLAAGQGSAGLARYLARSGISHVVLRNDLDSGAAGAARPTAVREALWSSPGISRVATFGPVLYRDTTLLGRVLDAGLLQPARAVEVYQVADVAPQAQATPLADAVTVRGGPDAVLSLEERDLLGGRPALVADGGATEGPTLVSDALVRRERTFGQLTAAESGGLTADDPLRLDNPARDYLVPDEPGNTSVVEIAGGTVTASSSAADADSLGGARPSDTPFAAVDGDLTTAWRPAERLGGPAPAWWQVTADEPIEADWLRVAVVAGDGAPTEVVVRTDAGERTQPLLATSDPQLLQLPAGSTRTVRLGAVAEDDGGLALAEVDVPGLALARTVRTPVPDGPVEAWSFQTSSPSAGCLADLLGRVRCTPSLVRGGEEPGGIDRVLTAATGDAYDVAVTATPTPGPALDALLATAAPAGVGGRLQVAVSSAVVPDPRAGAQAMVDGDPGTTWTAAADDRVPSLTLRWDTPRTIDRVRLVLAPGSAATTATAASVTTAENGLQVTVAVDDDGTVAFPAVTTDRLTLELGLADQLSSFDPTTRLLTPLGVGVSEVQVPGNPPLDPAAVVEVPCGSGPVVTVDGVARDTGLRSTVGDLLALRPVALSGCGDAGPVQLAAGEHRFAAASTAALAVTAAQLTRVGAPAREPVEHPQVTVTRWDDEDRAVQVGVRGSATLLVVPENANPGWTATLDGAALEARTVDGWQQGWVLPAGAAAEVQLSYRPGDAYRLALLAGAVAVLALLCLVALPARRPTPPGTGRHRRTGAAVLVAGAVGMALLGGWVGVLTLAGVAGLAAAARGRRDLLLGGLAGGALLLAGAGVLLAPGTAGEPVRQVLALVALAAVVVAVLPPGPAGPLAGAVRRWSGTRSRQRLSGRSTSR